jgi:hypothetical protein
MTFQCKDKLQLINQLSGYSTRKTGNVERVRPLETLQIAINASYSEIS